MLKFDKRDPLRQGLKTVTTNFSFRSFTNYPFHPRKSFVPPILEDLKQFKSNLLWYSLATSPVKNWGRGSLYLENMNTILQKKKKLLFRNYTQPLFMNFQEVYFSWVSSLFTLEMGLTVSLLVTYFSSGQLLRKKHLETTSMKWHSVPDFSL